MPMFILVDTDNFGDSIALTDALIESGHQKYCLPACSA